MAAPKQTDATRRRANSRRPRDKTTGRYVTKFTPELGDKVCDAVRAGNYMETAAAFAGVHKDTFYEWQKVGRAAQAKTGRLTALEQQLADWVAQLEQALAQAEVRDLAIIGKAAETQWQAAAWRLERKSPDRFGRRQRVEMTGADGGPLEVENVAGAADRLRARLGANVGSRPSRSPG